MKNRTNRKKGTRRYYAEFCPYGLNSISDGDRLMVFDSAEERNEMVERLNKCDRNWHIVEGVACAISREEASRTYRVQDFGTEYEREVYGLRTCENRCFFEVGSKRGGALL